MQFAPIENAIRAWVKTATGFADALIYFADQSGPQPVTNPFITIKIGGGIRSLGAYDEFTTSTNLANPPGTEITQLISGQRDLLVTVTIWGENTVTYAPSAPGSLPGTGGLTAVEVATKIQTALGLESVRAALNAANLSPYDIGEVRRIDGIIETYFEGRAILEVRMYSVDQQSEANAYFKEVQGTGTLVEDGQPNRTAPFDIIGT